MFNGKKSPRFISVSALFILLTGFKGGMPSALLNADLVPLEPGQSAPKIAWKSLPLPPPPVERREGGSRDGLLCLLTPGNADGRLQQMWHGSPQFVWAEKFLEPDVKSSIETILVVQPHSQRVVWTQTLTEIDNSLATAVPSPWRLEQVDALAATLQPGQTYEWIALDRRHNQLASGVFQIMPAAQQATISADLTGLEKELSAKGASAEQMAFEKATYFTERQLWSDALQVIYSVEDPSQPLMDLWLQIPEHVCQNR
jgi:hypothetical protein